MRERTILFVDDEEKSRKYFRMIYRRTFKILIAADGREALQLFTENRKEIGDRKSVVQGKSVDLRGRRIIKNKTRRTQHSRLF